MVNSAIKTTWTSSSLYSTTSLSSFVLRWTPGRDTVYSRHQKDATSLKCHPTTSSRRRARLYCTMTIQYSGSGWYSSCLLFWVCTASHGRSGENVLNTKKINFGKINTISVTNQRKTHNNNWCQQQAGKPAVLLPPPPRNSKLIESVPYPRLAPTTRISMHWSSFTHYKK